MATNDKETTQETEERLRADLEQLETNVPEEEAPAPEEKEEKPEGFLVFKATAGDAIAYIRECEDVSEVYDLIQAEEKGKARKTIIQEGTARARELNILKETAREEALAVLETPDLTDSGADAPEIKAQHEPIEPIVPEAVEEYPVEDGIWEGEMGRYVEIKHLARTMHPMGGVDERVMSPVRLNEKIEDEFFSNGFELIKVLPQGFGPDGVSLLYVLGKVRPELESKHDHIWHIQRTLTERPMISGGVTGFQADKYLNSFLSDGWQLFAVNTLKDGDSEIPMLWVLVR